MKKSLCVFLAGIFVFSSTIVLSNTVYAKPRLLSLAHQSSPICFEKHGFISKQEKKPIESTYPFGDNPFFEFGKEIRDVPYDGNLYNEIYNYGKDLTYDEIQKNEFWLRSKGLSGGEFLAFLDETCIGTTPSAEVRAVTVNGEEQPYRFLYIRLHYPEKYLLNESYSKLYDTERDFILSNCGTLLVENGIDTVMFSMYINGEMSITSIVRQQNGSFE